MRELWRRWKALIGGRSLDHDLEEELRFHMEMKSRETDDPAQARRTVGSALLWRERSRDAWGWRWLDDWRWDVRYALRMFRRNPGFTAVAVMMLALGIGINGAVFTVTDAAIFKGFPLVHDNDRIVYLTAGSGCCASYPDFEDWRAQTKSFTDLAAVHGLQKSFSDGSGFPETYITTDVSANTFKVIGQEPLIGRDFTHADETPGAPPVAILRYSFWARRYGKDPAVIGRTVEINGELTTIIGVMPPGFSFPQNQELWMAMQPPPGPPRRDRPDTWFVFGRLAPGATIGTARTEMETIGQRLLLAYPRPTGGRDLRPHLKNFHEFFIGPNSTIIYEAMLVAVGFVLLIACANLANLLLARAIGRSKEVSVRIALGAGRWRIVRQLLIESVMLSAVGGVLGWWIARWAVWIYTLETTGLSVSDTIGGNWFDNVLDYTMDSRVLVYLLAISIVTGILFGLAPASRLSKLDSNSALKDGGRGTAGRRARRLSALLVIGEMTLAVVLLAGAGVMIRSFLKIYSADIGVKTEDVLAASFSLPKERYPDIRAQTSFYDRLETRVRALPGVESVAAATIIPTAGARRFAYELAGDAPGDEQQRPAVPVVIISPDYFRTLGSSLLAGREFNDRDGASGTPAVIVNERFASEHWPGEDALGKRVRLYTGGAAGPWLTVAGIARNIVQNDFTRQTIDSLVYLPYHEMPVATMWIFARTQLPPANLANAFRRAVQAIDPDLPTMLGPFPLDSYLAWNYQYRAVSGVLFLIFAAIAVLLAAIGLYAVIAHSVSQRTQEIGIRMAIGADARNIVRLVFRQGMIPLGIGLAMGIAGSLAVNQILKSVLVQVSPSDPVTLAVASGVLIIAAILGCAIPARRAMRVDPVIALRHD